MGTMARKKKVKEPIKLWEVPVEALEKEIVRLEKICPTSGFLSTLKREVARTDRSGPMNHEDNED